MSDEKKGNYGRHLSLMHTGNNRISLTKAITGYPVDHYWDRSTEHDEDY